MKSVLSYYDIEVVIEGLEPAPQRRFLLYSGANLEGLHDAIQVAFSWSGEQMWVFRESPDSLDPLLLTTPLVEIFGEEGQRSSNTLFYLYNKEVNWVHCITLKGVVKEREEDSREEEDGERRWRELLEAEHLAPLEVCRSVADYQNFRLILETGEREGHDAHLLLAIEEHGLTREELTLDFDELRGRFYHMFDLDSYYNYTARKKRCSYVSGEPLSDFLGRDMGYYVNYSLTNKQTKVLNYIEDYCKSYSKLHPFDENYLLSTWVYIAPTLSSAYHEPALCAYAVIYCIGTIFESEIDKTEVSRYLNVDVSDDLNLLNSLGFTLELKDLLEIENLSDNLFEFVNLYRSYNDHKIYFTTRHPAPHLLIPKYKNFMKNMASFDMHLVNDLIELGMSMDIVASILDIKHMNERPIESLTYRDIIVIEATSLLIENMMNPKTSRKSEATQKSSPRKSKAKAKGKSHVKKARKKHR